MKTLAGLKSPFATEKLEREQLANLTGGTTPVLTNLGNGQSGVSAQGCYTTMSCKDETILYGTSACGN